MATKPLTTTKLFSKLLAPLSSDEVQVGDKRFLRELQKDMSNRWTETMRATRRAEHTRLAAEDSFSDVACAVLWKVIDVQMAVPAGTKAALNWKLGYEKFLGGCECWDAAIAKDKDFLALFHRAGLK